MAVRKCDGAFVADHSYVGVIRMAPGLQVDAASHGCDGFCSGHGDSRGYSRIKLPFSLNATDHAKPLGYGCAACSLLLPTPAAGS